VPKGDNIVLKAKKTTFSSRHGLCDILFLFLGELGTCLQNLIPTIGVEHWKENHFPQGGMLKFTYKGHFLTIKKAHKKLLYWKSKWWAHALVCPLYRGFFFWKKLNLNFWRYFKVPQANCLWTNFDKIWHFWTDSAAMPMAGSSMPSFERKKKECHNFCKKC
jgi:hypothetical protein